MSKNKSSKTTSTQVRTQIDYLPSLGDESLTTMNIAVVRCVEIDSEHGGPLQMTKDEAIRFGRALLKAADELDGQR